MNNQGQETNEIENQPRIKTFNLNMILTCNISTVYIHVNCNTFVFIIGLINYPLLTSFTVLHA